MMHFYLEDWDCILGGMNTKYPATSWVPRHDPDFG